jgi:hypothetical protein
MARQRGQRVGLDFVAGGGWACLREVAGHDEEWIEGRTTATAIELVDRLLVDAPGALRPGDAATLTAADRDTVLAAIYATAFGPRIEGTRACVECAASYDLAFELTVLVESVRRQRGSLEVVDGIYRLPAGARFRLPTGADEVAVAELAPADAERVLLERCLVEGDARRDGAQVVAAMAHVAPTLGLDLDATCPECSAHQALHFDVQEYLLGKLAIERPRLVDDVHVLASAYGWGYDEILSLRRSARRAHVALLDGYARSA